MHKQKNRMYFTYIHWIKRLYDGCLVTRIPRECSYIVKLWTSQNSADVFWGKHPHFSSRMSSLMNYHQWTPENAAVIPKLQSTKSWIRSNFFLWRSRKTWLWLQGFAVVLTLTRPLLLCVSLMFYMINKCVKNITDTLNLVNFVTTAIIKTVMIVVELCLI